MAGPGTTGPFASLTSFLLAFLLFSSSLGFVSFTESLSVVLVGFLKGVKLTVVSFPNYYCRGPFPSSFPHSHFKKNPKQTNRQTNKVSKSEVCKILFDETPRWTTSWVLVV